MWYRGARYRHRNCLDIDIEVIKVMFRDSKRVKLKVQYINQRSGLSLGFSPERVEIKKEDFKNWSMPTYNFGRA